MLNPYEQRLVAFYLSNVATRLRHHDREASELADWLASRENRTVFGSGRRRPRMDWAESDFRERLSTQKWCDIQDTLRNQYEATKRARHDHTAQRLRRLGKTVGLAPTDIGILELLLRYQTQPVIESMIDDIFGRSRRERALNLKGPALTALLGKSARTI